MAKRRFEYQDAKSDKFWEIELSGESFRVGWGRRGTAGQSKTKAFSSTADATKEHDKLVAQKLRSGYVEKMAGSAQPSAAKPKKATKAAKHEPAPTPTVHASSSIKYGNTALKEELLAVENHGHTLNEIYVFDHAALQPQVQYQAVNEDLQYSFLTSPNAPPTTLFLKRRYGKKLFDVMHMDPGVVVHKRVADLFRERGFTGWVEVPVVFGTKADQKPSKTHVGIKVTSVSGGFARETQDDKFEFNHIFDLRTWDGCDFFRPQGDHGWFYFVTKRVIGALQEEGVTGWRAERVSDEQEILGPTKPIMKKPAPRVASGLKPAPPKILGARPTEAVLRKLIGKHGLQKRAKELANCVERSALIELTAPQKGTVAIGASRCGGVPDLPQGFQWPVAAGKPLAFLMQLRLSDFAKHVDGKLPSKGLLSVFIGVEAQDVGVWEVRPKQWRVELFDDDAKLETGTPPSGLADQFQLDPCGFAIRPMLSLPHYEAKEIKALKLKGDDEDAFMDLREDLEGLNKARKPIHRLLGHGDWLQREGCAVTQEDAAKAKIASGKESWRLLLQLDSDDRLGVSWVADGLLYILMPEVDLARGEFGRSWMFTQYT